MLTYEDHREERRGQVTAQPDHRVPRLTGQEPPGRRPALPSRNSSARRPAGCRPSRGPFPAEAPHGHGGAADPPRREHRQVIAVETGPGQERVEVVADGVAEVPQREHPAHRVQPGRQPGTDQDDVGDERQCQQQPGADQLHRRRAAHQRDHGEAERGEAERSQQQSDQQRGQRPPHHLQIVEDHTHHQQHGDRRRRDHERRAHQPGQHGPGGDRRAAQPLQPAAVAKVGQVNGEGAEAPLRHAEHGHDRDDELHHPHARPGLDDLVAHRGTHDHRHQQRHRDGEAGRDRRAEEGSGLVPDQPAGHDVASFTRSR
ncbi:MAG: hypothetical protein K0R62_7081 [Nonomuraea muscovyensis]|nr:hypothetical protein [Nonomuraea muscovyensis]